MEVLRYSRNGGRTFAYIHKCTYMCACRNVHPNIYFHIYVCVDQKLHTKYVCGSSLLMRLGLVAFPPLGLEASSLGWVPSKRRQKIAMFEKGHFSPLTQLANELQLGVLLIIRFNHLWNGHFWKASIIWNCDGTWSGWGPKKLTFRKHLKSSQVPYDPER